MLKTNESIFRIALMSRSLFVQRTVPSVFMSEDNRQLVEGLIRNSQPAPPAWPENDVSSNWEAAPSSGIGSTESFATDFAAARSGTRPSEADISTAKRTSAGTSHRLLAIGFSEGDVSEAMRLVGSSASFGTLVDWLVLHVAESRLPKQFCPEASGAHVEVVRKGPRAGGAAQADGTVGQYAGVSSSCREVMERGFSREEAERALEDAGGDVDAALCILSRSAMGETGAAAAGGMGAVSGASSCSAEELQEERVALAAIYGDDFSELAAADGLTLCVRLPSRGAGEERTRMEFRFPASCHYPQEAPCISFRNSRALPAWLRRLTVLALKRAQELLGEPMLWALVEGAMDHVATLDVEVSTPDQPERVSDAHSGASEKRRDAHHSGSEQSSDACESGSIGQGVSRPGEQAPSLDESRRGERRPSSGASDSGGPRQGCAAARSSASGRGGGAVPPAAVQRESERLQQHWQRWQREGRYANMRQARAALPAAKQKGQLMDAIEGPDAATTSKSQSGPRVTIVCGQTGCGKSTQVPQYILEHWTERQQGGKCNVVVTQPRRVAAIGLAERVAAERGEKVGETVGYSVRLESQRSARTRLLFCTTGVLLRRLQGEPGLGGVTHVVVDEVHERTVEGDLLLLLLRTLISDGRNDLTLVLMSATADANELAAYFGSGGVQRAPAAVAVVSIPGFTHPVRELYLEDVLEMTGEVIGARSRYAKRKAPGRKESSSEGGKTNGRQIPACDTEKPPRFASKEVSQKEGRSEIPQETKLGKASSSQKEAGGVIESWDAGEESEDEDFESEKETSKAGGEAKEKDWVEADTSGGLPAEALQLATAADAPPRQRPNELGKPDRQRAEAGREYSDATKKSVENVEEETLNYELVEKVVCKILEEEQRPTTR
jgi:ATP-dependent RNA helicase DHX57